MPKIRDLGISVIPVLAQPRPTGIDAELAEYRFAELCAAVTQCQQCSDSSNVTCAEPSSDKDKDRDKEKKRKASAFDGAVIAQMKQQLRAHAGQRL